MSKHTGEHPRMGATDVCPLVPIANISNGRNWLSMLINLEQELVLN